MNTKENIKKPVYPKLEAELARNGLTYKSYGEILGLSKNSISNRMNGNVLFNIAEIKKTLFYFKKAFHELF